MNIILPPNYTKPDLPMGKAWIAALRSGEYKQATGALQTPEGHCCLGVLSKVQGRLVDGHDGKRGVSSCLSAFNPLATILDTTGVLPPRVVIDNLEANQLTAFNDRGYTFEQIATIIETVWNPL